MLAVVVLALAWGRELAGGFVVFITLMLAASMLAAVHHAEVVVHHVWCTSCVQDFLQCRRGWRGSCRCRDTVCTGAGTTGVHCTRTRAAVFVGVARLCGAALCSRQREVGLANNRTYAIAAGLPISIVGVAIALLVLLPAAVAAVRAAHHNRIETSLNLAFGSAMACIGLTIPTIAIASIW